MAKPTSPALQTSDPQDTAGLVADYPFISDLINLVTGGDALQVYGGGSVTYPMGPEGPQVDLVGATTWLEGYAFPWLQSLGVTGVPGEGFAIAYWVDVTTVGEWGTLSADGQGTNPVGDLVWFSGSAVFFAPGSSIHGWASVPYSCPGGSHALIVVVVDGLTVSVYQDGARNGTLTLSAATGSVGNLLRFSLYNGVSNGGVDGDGISIRAWDAPLSAAEVAAFSADWWSIQTAGGGGQAVDVAPASASPSAQAPAPSASGAVPVDASPAGASPTAQAPTPAASGAVQIDALPASASPAARAVSVSPGPVAVSVPSVAAAPIAQPVTTAVSGSAPTSVTAAQAVPLAQSPGVGAEGTGVSLPVVDATVTAGVVAPQASGSAAANLAAAVVAPSARPALPAASGSAAVSAVVALSVPSAQAPAVTASGAGVSVQVVPAQPVAQPPAMSVSGAARVDAVVALAGAVAQPPSTNASGWASVAAVAAVAVPTAFAPLIVNPNLAHKTVRLLATGGRVRLVGLGGSTRLEAL